MLVQHEIMYLKFTVRPVKTHISLRISSPRWRLMKPLISGHPRSVYLNLWSDCVDAKTGLNLRFAHVANCSDSCTHLCVSCATTACLLCPGVVFHVRDCALPLRGLRVSCAQIVCFFCARLVCVSCAPLVFPVRQLCVLCPDFAFNPFMPRDL